MKSLHSKYRILTDKNLIVEFHKGELTATNFIQFKTALAKDPLFNPNFNFIISLTDTTVKATENNIKEYVNFIQTNISYKGKRKVAIITKTPDQVVSSMLYKMMHGNPNQIIEIFSTLNNAVKWINTKKLNVNTIKSTLQSLKNQ